MSEEITSGANCSLDIDFGHRSRSPLKPSSSLSLFSSCPMASSFTRGFIDHLTLP